MQAMLEDPLFPPVQPEWRRDMRDAIQAMPASQLFKLQVRGFSREGLSRIDLPVRKELTHDGRNVLGGIVGVLADYAGVTAAACTNATGWFATTVSFEIHNVAPATGLTLVAIGRAQHVGKSTGVSRVEVHAVNGAQVHLACVATTTCRLYEIP